MNNLSTQPYRGTRDFYPEDQWLQNYIFSIWRYTCVSFGYEEYNTPTIEPLELYASKTSDEIVNEQTFSFTDRGDREVTIRPEMTPSVARLVAARRQELGYPLRLFSMQNFMRYERPQKGRLREFWQLNADIFGLSGLEADFEIIKLADTIMKAFGATDEMYEIRVNSRQLLNKRVEQAGVKTSFSKALSVIDARDKLPREEYLAKLGEHIADAEGLDRSLESDGPSEEIKQLKQRAQAAGITLTPVETLARGFDYYTDVIFEVFDRNPDNNRSMFGGGRYDNLLGSFGVDPIGTVGFGMGDAVLIEFLHGHDLVPAYLPDCRINLLPLTENIHEVEAVADELRKEKVAVAVDYSGRKLDKMIKTALKQNRPYVLLVGDDELKNGKYSLKNLQTQEQEVVTVQQLADKFAI